MSGMIQDDLLVYPSVEEEKETEQEVKRDLVEWDGKNEFILEERTYQQQFSDLYFLRLLKLKPSLEAIASEAWDKLEIHNEQVIHSPRVLDVRQGQLCWITGTIFMELPLKPNILDDLAKENYVETTVDKYTEDPCDDINLEDESGRIRLTGSALVGELLVTGCVVAVLGSETADGEFEVIDMKFPDIAPQPPLPPTSERQGKSMILVSGLNVSGEEDGKMELELLLQYLTGELCGPGDQEEAGTITHLVIAGNSLCVAAADEESTPDTKPKPKRYGYDPNSYNPKPALYLDEWLSSILPSLPTTIIPGELDPANYALPQQPLHRALLPRSQGFSDIHFVTNPWVGEIGGVRLLGTAGQNLDDAFRYIPPAEGDVRLDLLERTLRWRCVAPTCPDTLWTYPFNDRDPFVIEKAPHVYFAGNQPEFGTREVVGPNGERVTIIMLPRFADTKQVVRLDLETMQAAPFRFVV